MKKSKRKGSKRTEAKSPPEHAHIPTDQQRSMVRMLTIAAVIRKEICEAFVPPISLATLKRHYAPELTAGLSQIKAQLVNGLISMALGRGALFDENGNKTREEIAANPACLIFANKTIVKLRETTRLEHVFTGYDLTKLDEKEFEAFEALARKAAVDQGSADGEAETRH